jgi:uncharacterized protein (TIGR00661 family)
MRILYGVQATGNGHITRARIMAQALKEVGAEVDWVFSGREAQDFFDMGVFGNYRCFRGFTFAFRHGKVLYGKTLLTSNLWRAYQDIRTLDVSDYDVIINDFEPISAWAAKRAGKPVIGLSHQNAFLYDIPKGGDNVFVRWFMRNFAPVTQPIGLHWHHFDQPILPPLIEEFAHYHTPVMPRHYLVYLPFAGLDDILPPLRNFPEYRFHVYHAVSQPLDEAHIHIRPFSREGFQRDLHRCEGIICSAGFELPSEGIQLGKKLLVQPVVGQMEQQSNALALQQLDHASVMHTLDVEAIGHWLTLPKPEPTYYPNVAQAVARWLAQGNGEPVGQLAKTLWQETEKYKTRNPPCRDHA